jgi:hypothetical protein
LVPAVPLFIDRLELVPLPIEAEPLAPPQPGRFVDAEPDELSVPEELLFRVDEPGEPGVAGDVVAPLMPEEPLLDPLAAAPPDELPLLWAKAVATLSVNAIPVRGYKIFLSIFMRAHSVACQPHGMQTCASNICCNEIRFGAKSTPCDDAFASGVTGNRSSPCLSHFIMLRRRALRSRCGCWRRSASLMTSSF